MVAGPLTIPRPAVLFEHGPWHGWSRFKDETLRTVASSMAEGFEFPYRQTKRTKKHPWTGTPKNPEGVQSEIWTWKPSDDLSRIEPRFRQYVQPGYRHNVTAPR